MRDGKNPRSEAMLLTLSLLYRDGVARTESIKRGGLRDVKKDQFQWMKTITGERWMEKERCNQNSISAGDEDCVPLRYSVRRNAFCLLSGRRVAHARACQI